MPYETLDPDTYRSELIEMGASAEEADAAANELKERQR